MERERFERVMALFEETLELPVEERSEHLERVCGGDEDLQKQVESLLEQAEVDDGFLESEKPGDVIRESFEGFLSEAGKPAETVIPVRIGPYRILRLLGRGGMGAVYEAEQEHPRRRVALKVMRTPFLADELRSRFEQEAEILGRLRHPGIAHIYEAGVTQGSDGEPVSYFAMELVHGIPLTRHAEQHQLNTRDRLTLVAKICDAVDHAHGHGVVHRDLKPDNILVDERGEPKVLDFGVARIVDHERAARSMATATGLLIGTLTYMSPEQVGARPDEVDGRSDVYALGVIAFELLAGRLPLDVSSVSIPEGLRRIRDVDSPDLGSVDSRHRGDVATIVAKCLEKEPGRRYASAADLSRDIRRYLADEPILARPQSGFYQLRKFARRNKAIVAGVLVAFLALVAGTIVATRQAVIANRERATAVEFQHRAEHQAYQARVAAAATAIESHDTVLAHSNLEAAPEHLRGWEWRHLHTRLDQSSWAFDAGTSRHTEVRFAADDKHLAVLDRSSMPFVVFSLALAADPEPLERFPVGMSRPYRAPLEAQWQAIRSIHFVRGESQIELTDPSGGGARLLRRCGDALQGAQGTGVRALAADGRRALLSFTIGTTPAQSEVRLCDLDTGEGGPAFRIPYGWAFSMSSDGSTLAVSPKIEGATNRVDLFSTKDGAQLGAFRMPLDDFTALELSHDGGLLAAGSFNGVLRLWNVEKGQLLAERRAHNGNYISVVRFGPDGTRIASGGTDRTVHLWPSDLSGQPVILHGHADHVYEVRFSRSGDRLASADRGGSIRLWNLDETLAQPQVLRGHESYVNPVCYSPDGRLIVSGSWDGTVKIWDAMTGEELRTLDLSPGVEFGVTSLAIDEDGFRLAAGTTHAGIFLYDLVTGRSLGSTDPGPQFSYLEFAPGGEILFAGTSWEDLLLLDARTLEVVGREPFGIPFAWSPDGKHLLLRDSETSLIIRQGGSGPALARLEPVDDDTNVVAWSPDGKQIVTASSAGAVQVWDAGSGEPLGSLGTHTGPVHAAKFHPDGTRVALAGDDGVIRLFDPHSREELVQLRGHEAYVFDLAWSPDGDTLVSASGDGTLRLWHSVPLRERRAQLHQAH